MVEDYLPKYISSVFFVSDVEKSKKFYNKCLKLKITMDHGRCINFENGLSIWDKNYALNIISLEEKQGESSHNSEIYFESNNLKILYDQLKNEKINFVHEMMEQPWGQRCFRIYDPDGHIVEFGEPMNVLIQRLSNQGMSVDQIEEKTTMPNEIIKKVLEV